MAISQAKDPGASWDCWCSHLSSPLTALAQTPHPTPPAGHRKRQRSSHSISPEQSARKGRGRWWLPLVPTWLSESRLLTASPGSQGKLCQTLAPVRELQGRPRAQGSSRRTQAQKPNQGWDSPQVFTWVPVSCLCSQGRPEPTHGSRPEGQRRIKSIHPRSPHNCGGSKRSAPSPQEISCTQLQNCLLPPGGLTLSTPCRRTRARVHARARTHTHTHTLHPLAQKGKAMSLNSAFQPGSRTNDLASLSVNSHIYKNIFENPGVLPILMMVFIKHVLYTGDHLSV